MRSLLVVLVLLCLGLPAAAAPPIRVLVLELKAQDVPPAWSRLATELVAARLAEDAGLEVMTRADLSTLAELGGEKAALGCDENGCLAELAGALGARYVIYGDVGLLKPSYMLTLKLFDAERARVERRLVRVFAGAGELPALVPALVPKLTESLAVVTLPSSVSLAENPKLGTATSSTPPSAEVPAAPSTPAAETPKAIAARLVGSWKFVSRHDLYPDKPASGILTVEELDDGVLYFRWRFANSKEEGIGLVRGRWVAVAVGGPGAGISVYEGSGRKLPGVYVQRGKPGFAVEELERVDPGAGLVGTWRARGTNPRGKAYENELWLTQKRGMLSARWVEKNATVQRGYGWSRDDHLFLAFGRYLKGAYLYEILSDGTLRGRFQIQGRVGGETLTPR